MGQDIKFVSILLLYVWHVLFVTGGRSGPFKASFARVERCPNPSEPVDKDPAVTLDLELYNTTTEINLMKGKVVVLREHKIKKMKAKSYLWDNNKWKVSYIINNMGCNRIFFPILVMATGVKYDTTSCTFNKGEYQFGNYNLNKIQHFWMQTQEYGRVLWRVENFSHAGSIFCYKFETLIEPDQ